MINCLACGKLFNPQSVASVAISSRCQECINIGRHISIEGKAKIDIHPIKLTELKIIDITNSMQKLLVEKNKRYGDAALNPLGVFSKLDSANSIRVRLDDKLQRVKNCNTDLRINDVCDIIGYCTLLLISMGCTQEDINKLID